MIDIKQLRVGTHINIGGKRHCVSNIDALNGQIGIGAYKTGSDGVKHAIAYKIEDAEPIPITAELLKEIGFKLFSDFDFRTGGTLDTGDYYIIVTDDEYHYWQCQITERFGLKDNIVICCGFNTLHQLENIVYNATETELIKED